MTRKEGSYTPSIEVSRKGLIKIGKTVFISFLIFSFAYFLAQYVIPAFAAINPGSGPYSNSTGDMLPVSVNISRGDIFFADGNNVFIAANYTCTPPHVCNESMTVVGNFSSIGVGSNAGNRTGLLKQNGTAPGQTWALFELNGTVNVSNITGVTLPILVNPSTIVLFATDGNKTVIDSTVNINATVVIMNMSVIPSCPPAGTALPPKMPLLNGTLVPAGAATIGACIKTCSGDDIAEQNSTGDWNMCGINFGGASTNFTQVADTGNFSNFSFTVDIPGKAKINFTTNVSMDTQQKAQALFEFAMKNVMSGGRIGVNESEWSGGTKPNLTMSARLTVYNFSQRFGLPAHVTPSISRRATYGSGSFSSCGTSCSDIVWDGENITFTVSGFSEYQITRGLGMVANSPSNQSYATARNVNFTFTPTWNDTANPTNTSLFLNISGIWQIPGSNSSNQSSLVNNTVNGINYTFSQDGHYLWNARIYDTNGASDANTINWSVIVDTANPAITISSPTKGTYYDSQVNLKFTASDTEGISSCNYQVDSGTKKSADINKDILVSNLANGDRKITVNCNDNANNNASTSVTVTISGSSSPSGTAPSGVSTPVISTPTAEKTRAFIAKIEANREASIPINQDEVSEIAITVKNTATSVYVDVSRLEAKPAEVAEAPGTILRYLDIKPSGLAANDIDKATVKFKVEKTWMAANNIDSESVVLLRFADARWNELNTTKVSENDKETVYEAETPGFSYFAISGKEAGVTPQSGQPEAPQKETPTREVGKPILGTGIDFTVIALVIIVIFVGVFLVFRTKLLKKL